MFAQQQQQQFPNPNQQVAAATAPVQEDFYLLDLIGGASQHVFIQQDQQQLTVQFNVFVELVKGQCLQEVKIPKSQNQNGSYIYQAGSNYPQPKNIQISFEKVGSLFFVLESSSTDAGSGYRATLWNLNRQQRVEMVNQLELELQNSCLGLQILPKQSYSAGSLHQQSINANGSQYGSQQQLSINQRLKFLTLERQAIKIWEYQQGHADLLKRIQIKQNMKQCITADLTGYLLILGDNGKVLILDQEGEFISTVKKDMTYFTTITTAHDKLLLGTDRGTICVYHLASLQFINEVPYQLGVLQNFQLNQSNLIDKRLSQQQNQDPSVYSLGPAVLQISTTHNMRFLYIKYQDQSFVVLDRTVPNPSQAVLGYQYGHFQKVFWPLMGSSVLNNGKNANQNSSFITCAHDMSIFVWRHFGDRWSFSYIDVIKGCFDQSLSYQRKLNEKSTQNLELTSIKIYPKSPLVIVGDNKGFVRVFQVTSENALFIASHQLLKGIDQAPLEDPIKDIHITQDELYAIVSFKSGLICCYDVRNSFQLIGIIEKDAQRFCYSNQLEMRMKILENDNYKFNFSSLLNPLRIQDEKPIYSNTTYDHDLLLNPQSNTALQTSFRILSTTSPNCIQLQQIELKTHRLTKNPVSQFIIDEGKITGFDVHPSNDYLMVTSNMGRLYLYRIDTGELRGTIQIPLNAQDCTVDPSGLYVVVQVPPFNPRHTANLVPHLTGDTPSLTQNERDLERTTLLMFEVGTGRACAELKSLFEVSSLSFSPDGRFLSLGSRTGAVCVWALGEHLLSNIRQVLDAVRITPDFWANYPIFLEDYGTYGMAQTPLPNNQIFNTHDQRQLDRPEDYYDIQNQFLPGLQEDPNFQHDLLTSQRMPYSGQKSTQRYNQQQNYQNPPPIISQNLNNPIQNQQQQSLIRPPIKKGNQYQNSNARMIDQQIQNNSLSTIQGTQQSQRKRSIERKSLDRNQQVQKLQQQQQNKFYRKTYVEDQQTQVTPHISGYINNQNLQGSLRGNNHRSGSRDRVQQINQNNRISQRGAQIQTSQEDYHQQINQRFSPQKQFESQSSLISSPNRAELLYRDDFVPQAQPKISNQNFEDRQYPNQLLPQLNYPQNSRQVMNQMQQQVQQQSQRMMIPRQQDFIDRTTTANNNERQLGYMNQGNHPRNIFAEAEEQYDQHQQQPNNNFMRSIGQQQQIPVMTYEENLDAADLYNPFTLNQDILTHNLKEKPLSFYGSGLAKPLESMNQSPIKQIGTQQVNYGGGRLPQQDPVVQKQRDQVRDPIDIDDDVSDHGPDSLENQLKELDVMNKYMQNIRVPTRFVNDDFIAVNGRDGGERVYTLAKLREEERLINMGMDPDLDDPVNEQVNHEDENNDGVTGSNYDLVEEMYENMDQFDQRLKDQTRQSHLQHNFMNMMRV